MVSNMPKKYWKYLPEKDIEKVIDLSKFTGYEVIDYLYGYITKNYNGAVLLQEKSLDLKDFYKVNLKNQIKIAR